VARILQAGPGDVILPKYDPVLSGFDQSIPFFGAILTKIRSECHLFGIR
jgi:hypothetical protein